MFIPGLKFKQAVNLAHTICKTYAKVNPGSSVVFPTAVNLEIKDNVLMLHKTTEEVRMLKTIYKFEEDVADLNLVVDSAKLNKILTVDKSDSDSMIELEFREDGKELTIKGDYTSKLALYGNVKTSPFTSNPDKELIRASVDNPFDKNSIKRIASLLGFIKDCTHGNNEYPRVYIKDGLDASDGSYFFRYKNDGDVYEIAIGVDYSMVSLLKSCTDFTTIDFYSTFLSGKGLP